MLIYLLVLFFISLVSFGVNRKHLLSVLLSLEFIMLMLFMVLVFYFSFFKFDSYFLMVFLSFSVCEGSLGLSILVSMVRTHGNDYFSSFNLLW